MSQLPKQQFAKMELEPRWNKTEVVGFYDVQDGVIFSNGPMGVVMVRTEDVCAYVTLMRRYLDGLEQYAADMPLDRRL